MLRMRDERLPNVSWRPSLASSGACAALDLSPVGWAPPRDAAANFLAFLSNRTVVFAGDSVLGELYVALGVHFLVDEERQLLGKLRNMSCWAACFRYSTRPTSSSAPALRTRDATYPRATARTGLAATFSTARRRTGRSTARSLAARPLPILACSRGTWRRR